MNRICLAVLALATFVAALPAAGQVSSVAPVAPAKSGMVSYIQGSVYLDDELLPDPLVGQYPFLKEGGVLRTAEGRAEVVMVPGLSVHLGVDSTLRMISSQFEDTVVELIRGSAVAATPEVDKESQFALKIGAASIVVAKAGRYHFDAEPARVKVFSGLAKVRVGELKFEVPAGKMLSLNGDAASLEKFDKDETDALDRWSARRGELMAAANISSARNCNSSGFVSSGRSNPCVGSWRWNPWFNIYTYIPMMNRWCDPLWGYCYYNPMAAMRIYTMPTHIYTGGGGGGGGQGTQPAANRPAAAARTIDSSNRPVASPSGGSNSRGVARGDSSGGSTPVSSGGGIGSSGMGGGSMGGAVSSGGGGGGGGSVGSAGSSGGGGGSVAAGGGASRGGGGPSGK